MPTPISIAMATYNGQRFLPEQLASLAQQTLLPAELVVSDDASSDDTLGLLSRFARTAPFSVRVLPPHDRFGFADNFLHAAEHCQSPIVAFCDQDDVWMPHKLATVASRMAADQSLLAMHRLALTDAALQPIGEQRQQIERDRSFDPLSLDPYAIGWGNTMAFRRDLLTLIPRRDRPRQPEGTTLLSHDHWVLTLAAALGRVTHIRESLILYRQHEANVFGTETTEPLLTRIGRRLDTFRTVRLRIYRERAIFDAHMTRLLTGLADRREDEWRAPALLAAARFAERADRRERRVRLYDAPTLSRRAIVYWEFLRAKVSSPEAASARRRAVGKDLLLGVTGLGRRL